MNKKLFLPILSLALFGVTLTGCRKEGGGSKPTPPTPPTPPAEFTITLDRSNLSLKENETYKLVATTSEPATVTWSTSNEFFATVDEEGLVTAVQEGNATITASANGKSATCLVTITKDVPPGPEFTISLDYTELQLKVDEYQLITATTSEPATVTWDSSNPEVASVVDGLVTALTVGTTTITASANGKSATCEVEVKPKDPPVPVDTPVTLSWGEKTLVDVDDLYAGQEKGPYVVGLLATTSAAENFTGTFSVSLVSVETGAVKLIDYIYVEVYESALKEDKVLEINKDSSSKSVEVPVTVEPNVEKKLYFFIGMENIAPYLFDQIEGYVSITVNWS